MTNQTNAQGTQISSKKGKESFTQEPIVHKN